MGLPIHLVYVLPDGRMEVIMNKKLAAIFNIIIGISMIGTWALLLGTKNVVEIKTKPIEILFHIFSEIATALLLLISGFGIITNKRWSSKLFLLSMGALLYSVINAVGFYGQSGDFIMVIVFVVISVAATIFTCLWFKKEKLTE